ncbi:MAG: class I SAM-dependent methyltransferase [Flavobacteriales bacterium]|nr:class I SAM-dependent methyltransferase [Flavobacteriales bacterium]
MRERLYRWARSWAIARKYALIHRLQPNGRVLDLGCGTGDFLAHLMSRGYLVQGVEPSLIAREKAIADHGLSVVPSLDQVTAYEKFQVITMWHVLEHVADPRAVLKKLFALLSDRGLLVIAVPDRDCWDAAHYGPYWAAWDVPRHFNHFRRQDIHAMLEEHGFVRLATKPMWLDAFFIAMLSEQYAGASPIGALLKGSMRGLWSNVVALCSDRPTSSSLYLARKVEP